MAQMAVVASARVGASPAFNATFYATIATIIPVLYLALVVQGGGVDALLREALADLKAVWVNTLGLWKVVLKRGEAPQVPTGVLVFAIITFPFMWAILVGVAVAMTIAACLIAVAGSVSELCALYALYKQDDLITIPENDFGLSITSFNVSYIVLAGTGILILATTVLPFIQLVGRVRAAKAEPPADSSADGKPSPKEAD
jgi:hypothetical protein